jgi:hypothetical protein
MSWLLLLPHKELRSQRLAQTKWLMIKEVPRFIKAITLLFNKEGLSPKDSTSLRKLTGLIIKVWKDSGITFAITYWSEVLRLTLCSLDPKNKYLKNNKIWVKTHKSRKLSLDNFHGMPCILPLSVKLKLVQVKRGLSSGSLPRTDQIFVKLLFTILSFFRAASPNYSETKIRSITGWFTGSYLQLTDSKIKVALTSMGAKCDGSLFKSKPSLYFNSTKSGPNSTIAVLGIGLDLVGWIMVPKSWSKYVQLCYRRSYYFLLMVFVLCSLVILPYALLYHIRWYLRFFYWKYYNRMFSSQMDGTYDYPILGKLAVLKEARGKRRIIGITDWWTQVLLRPLHDDIYSFLSKIEQDGTKDQLAPILLLLKQLDKKSFSTEGKRLQSMDLSAATDRLPVVLQSQILNILGFEGDLWRQVLDREWYLDGRTVRYTVGQPMGALSSFAMLALTHHVIVRYSALNVKINPKKLLYAVLGDDMAMANKKVAKAYADLFLGLGMEINPIKGFDGCVLEFAKQLWSINKYNLSPFGSKNVLLFMRNVEFLPSILQELNTKRFPQFLRKKDALRSPRIPLVTADSLEKLISSLFFQKKKLLQDKSQLSEKEMELVKHQEAIRLFRVRLRVLMAIGPRSGLWYLLEKADSWIDERFIRRENNNKNNILFVHDFYWGEQFISALGNWGLWPKHKLNKILPWVKTADESRNKIIHDLIFTISKLGNLSREYLVLPFTYLPIENDISPRFSHFTNSLAWILIVFSPSSWNLAISLIKQLTKSFTNCYLLFRMRTLKLLFDWSTQLRLLVYLDREDFFYWNLLSCVLAFLLSESFIFLCCWFLFWYISYRSIITTYVNKWLKQAIDSTPGYDKRKAYNPLDTSITTIEKVVDKIKLEDSGAYKQITRMLKGNSQFEKYLGRKANSQLKRDKKGLTKTLTKHREDGPKIKWKRTRNVVNTKKFNR